jgi:hypothetical protein
MTRPESRITFVRLIAIAILLGLSIPLHALSQQAQPGALYLIHRNGLWGYSDRSGKVVVKPQFAMGGFFDHGTAEVWRNDNGQKHLVDTRGNVIKDRNFASDHFSEGLIPVKIEDKYGYEDEHGKMVIFPSFEYARDFSEGLATARKDGKFGYISHAGEFVIKPQFGDANDFSEGIALIRLSAIKSPTEGVLDGFTEFQKGAHDYGYINKAGETIIAPVYDAAGDFSSGLAPVCMGDYGKRKCGYIDATGKVVIDLKFERANSFSEGLASVKIGAKFGYIDTTGSVVIAPIFEMAMDFQGGLAYAGVGRTSYSFRRSVVTITFHGKQGYIDKTGRFASKPLNWDT